MVTVLHYGLRGSVNLQWMVSPVNLFVELRINSGLIFMFRTPLSGTCCQLQFIRVQFYSTVQYTVVTKKLASHLASCRLWRCADLKNWVHCQYINSSASFDYSANYSSILTPSTPAVPNCCCSKGPVPYWSNPLFLIVDIWAL